MVRLFVREGLSCRRTRFDSSNHTQARANIPSRVAIPILSLPGLSSLRNHKK
jgi:hypothetical protein